MPLRAFHLTAQLTLYSFSFPRCDRLNSCRVPVSSDLFGDPCPGTHKYVEIHYTCSQSDETAQQQRPPWYIQPPLNGSAAALPWLKDVIRSDLPLPPSKNVNNGGGAPRIPILVATTTSTPKRIPITTPPPPTTTTTVQSTSAMPVETSTSKNATDRKSLNLDEEENKDGSPTAVVGDIERTGDNMDEEEEEEDVEEKEEGLVEGSLVDMRGEEGMGEEEGDSCRPSLARNLYWQQTRRGQAVVQPCPNGATGLARWHCAQHQVRGHGVHITYTVCVNDNMLL